MAPRRSVKISTPEKGIQVAQGKVLGKRQKRGEPLKVPSVITISIPIKTTTLEVPDNQRKIDANTKIELANEVVRSQLLKEPIKVRPDSTPAPKKRGRPSKKEIVSEYFNDTQPPSTNKKVEVTESAAMTAKGNTKKKPTIVKKNLTRKRVADSTVQKPKIKRQKLSPKPAAIKEEPTTKDDSKQNLKHVPDTTEEKAVKDKSKENSPVFNPPKDSMRTRRTALKRGKQESKPTSPILQTRCVGRPKIQASRIVSPKPSAKFPKAQTEPLKLEFPCTKPIETETLDVNNAGQVESRKTSISSNSNLSWTRDISSSSTTTCITVASNDFVRFNKKLPVIKLTNIDSQINKYKGTKADDISSSDVSSDSDSETSCDQPQSNRSRLSFDSPNKVKSLNLSSSSRNSIGTPVEDNFNKDSNFDKKDYRQAAAKLVHALKNIDSEFINWLPNGVVASDLNIIKDKLFDILSSEFRALAHCRNLQRISKSGIVDGPDIYKETDNIGAPNIDIVHKGSESNEINTVERNKLESNNNILLEPYGVENNKNNIVEDKEKNIVCENIDGNNSHKVESNTTNKECESYKRKKFERNKFESVRAYETGLSKDETDKSNVVEQNKVENRKVNKMENIRIEVNRMGTKKVECNPVETSRQDPKDISTKPIIECKSEDVFVRPSTSGFVSNKSSHNKSSFQTSTEYNDSYSDGEISEDEENSPHSPYDDDDALSLFAESITGIESSRLNTSIYSAPLEKQCEEYVPKPIQNNLTSPQSYTYCPTKISEQNKNGVVKTVCEKQNADSTSICKDKVDATPSQAANNLYKTETLNSANNANKPGLLADLYKLKPKEINIIFQGYCYFNLINKCANSLYNQPCRFNHSRPSDAEVKSKLSKLTDELFIREYVLIRRNQHLMRMYGMCFVGECMRRQLTRMLVEMAYDFIKYCVKGFQLDETLKVAVVEITLLHLNHVDLSVCEDLLKLKHEDSLLCEVFMQIMTSTQNFSRFRSVFLGLTYFMVNNDRTFKLQVAEQILERVCILPFDEPVVRALIQILRLTSPEIFLNPSIEHFEKQISVNRDILEEYFSVKSDIRVERLARQVVAKQPVPLLSQVSIISPVKQPFIPPLMDIQTAPPPLLMQTVDKSLSVRPEAREGMLLPPSPDTTHLEHMNKTADDIVAPKITRTIWAFDSTPNRVLPNTSPSSTISNETVHNNWRNRSIFQQISRSFSSPRALMRPPRLRPPVRLMRKRQFNHRLVTLGGSPIMYPPPGPDYCNP